MLPWLENKIRMSDDGTEGVKKKDEPAFDVLHMIADEIMDAIVKKDSMKLNHALRAYFESCDASPHKEGSHNG